jgi:ATP-dependent helicase/nuclease subunit A
MPRTWTKPQQHAIEARGGSLLVSAAAGSGKTAVLVERVVGLLCDKTQPVDVDRLLIVTFSLAAAAEMRQRIGARLSQLILEQPGNLHLQRQQALLQKAQISTVHAFCLSLIRENFQNLNITPDFIVMDQGELELMKAASVATCVEEAYAKDEDGSFAALVELLATGRDDSRLVDTVYKIYDFSRSHPFYEDWLERKRAQYDTDLPISQTEWGEILLAHARETLDFCLAATRSALETLETADDKLQNAYSPAFYSDESHLETCCLLAENGDWDGLVRALAAFDFPALKPVRGDAPDKEALKATRARVKDAVGDLAEKYFCATEEEAAADIHEQAPQIHRLFSLVVAYGRLLDEAKQEKKRLDFTDLEHLALSLLVKKTETGYTRTDNAVAISRQFDYVLVDEYQDTNEAQDLIFTSIAREQQNLFMVGDVKQSIYSFRQAMPEIFLLKKERFYRYDGVNFPAAISLDTNFRSRKGVTGAVNFLFGRIMSRRMGEIEYDDEESLKYGADYPPDDDAFPELLLLGAADYAGDRDAVTLEADAVAHRIRELLESGYPIQAAGEERPAQPRDICILLRSPRNRAGYYVEALTRQGISAWAESVGGYLAAREVSMVLALLKALDNPLLDIELVAALLSPLFGFCDDDIARIRLQRRGVPFFLALHLAAENGDERAREFLATFDELRRDADTLAADRLLLRVYEKTHALELSRAMPMGESRRANLLLLVEYAAQYHSMGHKRLAGFVGFLSRLEERGGDLSPANTLSEEANMVRVMSVHRSKGLEFPIVILADTAKQFNTEDLRANTILHSRYGFACVRRDRAVLKQYPTVPMQAIRLAVRRSQLSEEMRILYVALTRAREKLIISATIKGDLVRKLQSLEGGLQNGKLPPPLVGRARSCADWILMALLRHESAAALRERGGLDTLETVDDGNPWQLHIHEEWADNETAETAPEKIYLAQPEEALLAELERRIEWVYPYAAHTAIPAKLAVSAVAKGSHDVSRRFAARPVFLSGQKLTPAERGNALHKFMQYADYANARLDLADEIARMETGAFLSPVEAESLDREKLEAFFESPLANRLFASPTVWRELKFMAEFGREELGDRLEGMDDEARVILNGVADCIFLEEGEAVIIDYKTDRVKAPEELVARYAAQVQLYRRILSRSLGLPVRECILYSFSLSRAIPVL